jgi:hypothetical protein
MIESTPDKTSTETPEKDSANESARHLDTLLESLVHVARHHASQVSRDGLTAGLPLEPGGLSPSLLARAAERAGLGCRLLECQLESLEGPALPAILILKDDTACVLIRREAGLMSSNPEPGNVRSTHPSWRSATAVRPRFLRQGLHSMRGLLSCCAATSSTGSGER